MNINQDHTHTHTHTHKRTIKTSNSSGDEIANMNFLYDEARPPY